MLSLWSFASISTLSALLTTSYAANNVALPSFPLAVKSPYLSAWAPGQSLMTDAAYTQAQFWTGTPLVWPVLARVDGTAYALFGLQSPIPHVTAARTLAVNYTSSHTFVTLAAGHATFELDFFSPVLPGDTSYVDQSLPYSYLTITARASLANRPCKIQVLSGIDRSWTAQNGAANLKYATTSSAGYWTFNNPRAVPFTERNEQASYGSVLFGITNKGDITRSCAPAIQVYRDFTMHGRLTGPRAQCDGGDLAAISKNLNTVGTRSTKVTFAIGFDRVQAINYVGQAQTGLYRSKYSTPASAISYFLRSHDKFDARSRAFDQAVRTRSEAVSKSFGKKYADIVEASVRQTFGTFELTVPMNNTSATPSAFLKEISSNGDISTVDLIFQSWPIFISLNPNYVRYLLQPIMSVLQGGQWPRPWVIHDLGFQYPNATGYPNGQAEQMPLFETSCLFIMLHAYQKYTGDTLWTVPYLPLLRKYADWLAKNALYPSSQLSSVDAIAPAANQTALAIQSAIGLKAASLVLNDPKYATNASTLATELYDNALGLDGDTLANSTHFTYYYNKKSTWNVVFASYFDVLLGLKTFPARAWAMQSKWYMSRMQSLGLPYAGPVTYTGYTGQGIQWGITDWNIVASGASSARLQETVINTTHKFLTNGLNNIPFGTKYAVQGPNTGKWLANKARSSVGSHFALLALQQGTWGLDY